jgi:hypothetical protein
MRRMRGWTAVIRPDHSILSVLVVTLDRMMILFPEPVL